MAGKGQSDRTVALQAQVELALRTAGPAGLTVAEVCQWVTIECRVRECGRWGVPSPTCSRCHGSGHRQRTQAEVRPLLYSARERGVAAQLRRRHPIAGYELQRWYLVEHVADVEPIEVERYWEHLADQADHHVGP